MQFPSIVHYSENNNAAFQDDESISIVSIIFSPDTSSLRLSFCCHLTSKRTDHTIPKLVHLSETIQNYAFVEIYFVVF
jgi:hypothetical protein